MSDLVCLKSVSYPRALYDNKSHYRNEYQDVNPICYIAFCTTVKFVLDNLYMVFSVVYSFSLLNHTPLGPNQGHKISQMIR